MRGMRPLQWIWNWLGQGSMSEQYEVLPSVQPCIEVTPFEFPIHFGELAPIVVNLIAGEVVTDLPGPPAGYNRVWLCVQHSRSAPAVNDRDILIRQGLATGTVLAHTEIGAFPPANLTIPDIGNNIAYLIVGAGTALFQFKGRGPVVATADAFLRFKSRATAAVGTVSISGNFMDVPDSAPLPPDILA